MTHPEYEPSLAAHVDRLTDALNRASGHTPDDDSGWDFGWLKPVPNGTAAAVALAVPVAGMPLSVWAALSYSAAAADPISYGVAGLVVVAGAARAARWASASGARVARAVGWLLRLGCWSLVLGAVMHLPLISAFVHYLTGAEL